MINGLNYAQLHLHVHFILAFEWEIRMDLMRVYIYSKELI